MRAETRRATPRVTRQHHDRAWLTSRRRGPPRRRTHHLDATWTADGCADGDSRSSISAARPGPSPGVPAPGVRVPGPGLARQACTTSRSQRRRSARSKPLPTAPRPRAVATSGRPPREGSRSASTHREGPRSTGTEHAGRRRSPGPGCGRAMTSDLGAPTTRSSGSLREASKDPRAGRSSTWPSPARAGPPATATRSACSSVAIPNDCNEPGRRSGRAWSGRSGGITCTSSSAVPRRAASRAA